MKIKLLKKIRRRFYWDYNQAKHIVFMLDKEILRYVIYDRKKNKELWAITGGDTTDILRRILEELKKEKLYTWHLNKRKLRSLINKYRHTLQS